MMELLLYLLVNLSAAAGIASGCYWAGRAHGHRRVMRACGCDACMRALQDILADPALRLPFPWKQEADK